MDEYLILPGCDDTNRGDQALIWETIEVAKSAGFLGHYSMIAKKEKGIQSSAMGISSLAYLLPHPSSHAKKIVDNRKYSTSIKVRWAIYALRDVLIAYPLSKKITRPIVEKLLSKEQKVTLEVYKRAKAAFVKGGGFLHANGGLTDTYKIYYFLYHINLAHSMGIPVYVMPNSYGPFNSKMSSKMVKKCLQKCQTVYARESVSQTVLKKSCNIDVCLSNDLAMYLERDKKFDASMYLQSKGINIIPGRTVGITVRPYRFPESNNPEELYDNYKESVSELVIWLLEKEYYPVFIEHVYDDNYHERDIICINEISELLRLKGKHIDVFSDLSLNCKQLKAIYGAMDFVVGTRFHSVIFSLTELVPAVAITYGGNKGIGIMKDIGLSEYSVPISDISGEKLKTRVEDMFLKKDDIKVKLEELQRKSKQEYEKIVDAIKNKRLSTET